MHEFTPVSIDLRSKLSTMLKTGKDKKLLKIFYSPKKSTTDCYPFGIASHPTLIRTHKLAKKKTL